MTNLFQAICSVKIFNMSWYSILDFKICQNYSLRFCGFAAKLKGSTTFIIFAFELRPNRKMIELIEILYGNIHLECWIALLLTRLNVLYI